MRIPGTSHTPIYPYTHTPIHPYTHKPIHSQTHKPTKPPNFYSFASGASVGRRVPVRFGAPYSLDINISESENSFLPSTGPRLTIRGPILNKHNRTSNVIEAAGGIYNPLSPGETFRPLPPRTKQASASLITKFTSNTYEVRGQKIEDIGDDWGGHSMNLAGWIAMAGLYVMDWAGIVFGLFKKKKKKNLTGLQDKTG